MKNRRVIHGLIGLTLFLSAAMLPLKVSALPSAPPDTHVCGSEPGDYPNKPKVWLYLDKSKSDSPQDFYRFFIDKTGRGYFENLPTPLRRESALKNFGSSKDDRTFELWGAYAGERHERERNQYFIDVVYSGENITSYRIRGPHVTSPGWNTVRLTEEKSK